jgi:hypothetical protein
MAYVPALANAAVEKKIVPAINAVGICGGLLISLTLPYSGSGVVIVQDLWQLGTYNLRFQSRLHVHFHETLSSPSTKTGKAIRNSDNELLELVH